MRLSSGNRITKNFSVEPFRNMRPGFKPQTYRTDCVRLATELTAGQYATSLMYIYLKKYLFYSTIIHIITHYVAIWLQVTTFMTSFLKTQNSPKTSIYVSTVSTNVMTVEKYIFI